MLLAIDVGNTNITLGLFKEDELFASWRMTTNKNETSDEIGMKFHLFFQKENIDTKSITGVIISSVVPPIMYSLEHAVRKYIGLLPMIVSSSMKLPIKICYDNPKEVGADRIVNAVSAYRIYGGPIIIVDFGTATTFCCIDKDANYLGGLICPGIKISVEALFERASKLPRIELISPKKVIGTNTVSSMQSGVVGGYVGQVEYLVGKIKEEMGGGSIKVIATGGLGRMIASQTNVIDVFDKNLTLTGLKMIYEENKE